MNDLLQKLIMNKSDPMHNFNVSQEISAFGTVTPNINYQTVPNSPMAMINPQLNGDIRTPQIIQPRNVVMTKYDNKRKNTNDQIALFDWRNNTSLNNATKVPANYYQEKLTKTAKEKVRTKQMMDGYSTQYSYDEFNKDAITPKTVYNTESLQKKDVNYVLNYSDLQERNLSDNLFDSSFNVNSPSFNPMLPRSNLNKPVDDPSFADDRITHGNSDRPYTTKGDRLLQARELATSEYMKERRQLQDEAEQALKGTPKAPRMVNPNLGMGIKSQFYDLEDTNFENNSHKIKTNDNPIQNIHNITNNKYTNNTIQNSVKYKENSIDNYNNDLNIKERFGATDKSINLNLYSGRSSDLTKRNRLKQANNIQDFEYIDMNHKNKTLDPTMKKRYEIDKEYKNESFFTKLIEGFKSFFYDDDSNKTTINRKELFEDKYNSRYYDSNKEYEYFVNLNDIDVDKYISEYTKEQNRHNYWVVNKDIKYEFDTNDGVYKHTDIKEPISILKDEEDITRTVVVRDVDSIKVYQRKDDLETGETKYKIITLPEEYLDDKLREQISINNRSEVHDNNTKRFDVEVIDLDYEDHIKIGLLTEEAPDDFKLESDVPLSYHQRILLDQLEQMPTDIITNVNNIDDYLYNKFEPKTSDDYFKRDNINETFNGRDYIEDDNNKQNNYHIQFDNNVLRPSNQDHKMGIKTGKKMDPRDITRRFNQE